LKRRVLPPLHPVAALFPRLQRRGPIEASLKLLSYFLKRPGFRAFNGAAPLKHPAYGIDDTRAMRFRAFNGAAPLKHAVGLAQFLRRGRFRAFNGAAPLKRVSGEVDVETLVVSAPSTARPH